MLGEEEPGEIQKPELQSDLADEKFSQEDQTLLLFSLERGTLVFVVPDECLHHWN